jgi:hypothetical protein
VQNSSGLLPLVVPELLVSIGGVIAHFDDCWLYKINGVIFVLTQATVAFLKSIRLVLLEEVDCIVRLVAILVPVLLVLLPLPDSCVVVVDSHIV